MTVQLELWELLTALGAGLIAFLTMVFGLGQLLLSQIERRMDARHDQITTRLQALESANREESAQWGRVERELLQLKAELPLHYVRREDYVQAVATIMTKLDAMALRFENLMLKGRKEA